ncbi:MAG TPA: hypothetical protein HPQ00_00730 [Magnetococcales bacterium]|nr:hypothetical protein [Magnetococcales bacterium]
MFSTLTPRLLNNREIRSWIAAVHAASSRVFALVHHAAIFNPHMFHHWDLRARFLALFSVPSLALSRSVHLHHADFEKIRSWLESFPHMWAHINPLAHLDDRFVPHPGEVAGKVADVSLALWYATLRHVAIFLGSDERLEIIVKTDNHPKLTIHPEKGKRVIVFGNGCDSPSRKKEYVHIPDDELFHEHLVIGYSRFHGWQIRKMEGEFGCGSQYSTDSLNDSIPLSDCAIMRIGHTSILINVENKT